MMVAEATAQYEIVKSNWEDKLAELTPDWMNMSKITKEELEARLAKHAQEMDNGNYISAKEAFQKLDKEFRLSK